MPFMMFLATSIYGVFVSLDLFQLFFFFEIAVFPKYLMIVIWGLPQTREYGAMKLTLYLFIGSVIALVGALAMYSHTGLRTFDMLQLEQAGFSLEFQRVWFPVVFFGFAILGGIFPFHSWAPDGHVAAPTAISMLLAGVEMKVGLWRVTGCHYVDARGVQRMGLADLDLGDNQCCLRGIHRLIQTDFKYVIGFSSVSHMGLVMIGFATLSPEGLLGAGNADVLTWGDDGSLLCCGRHGVRPHPYPRYWQSLGGLFHKMPWAAPAL
jgi:NADH-quinone oxidoreductase subunit M